MDDTAIRVEHDGAAADRLVALCLRHPLPDYIVSKGPGIYAVDLPPDVKVLVHVTEAPNLLTRAAAKYTISIYRNANDRQVGLDALMTRRTT